MSGTDTREWYGVTFLCGDGSEEPFREHKSKAVAEAAVQDARKSSRRMGRPVALCLNEYARDEWGDWRRVDSTFLDIVHD
jgi:hypothetical protein